MTYNNENNMQCHQYIVCKLVLEIKKNNEIMIIFGTWKFDLVSNENTIFSLNAIGQ